MENNRLTGYPSIDRPWLKYYSKEAINAQMPNCSIYDYILDRNRDNMNHIAMKYYGTNITYRQMFRQINRMAGALEKSGIKVGEVVTVCMVNAPETAFLIFALNKIGAVANMVYGADTPQELLKHLTDANSTTVFTLDMFQDKFKEIADEAKLKRIIVTNITESMSVFNRIGARILKGMMPKPLPKDSRFCSWKQFFKNAPETSRTCHDGNEPAIITYTGGTTGGSKGVILSSIATFCMAWHLVQREPNLSRDNTWLQALPLFIAYGVTCSLLNALALGMTQIIRIPMQESISEMFRKFRPNIVIHGPAYWEKFADDNNSFDLSDFMFPTTGGDILRLSVEEKINNYLKSHGCPHPLINGYGMTEAGAGVTFSFPAAHRLGSVGIPLVNNIIAAFDIDSNTELPYGTEGEICICSPSLMKGYVNAPEETANIIFRHEDGRLWLHTGDLGYIDEDGFVFISGRLKRFFAYADNGIHKKIFSLDIEKVLLQHPLVENCAVVAIADSKTVQAPVAYIILKGSAGVDSESKVMAYGEEHLSGGYRPVKYYFVDKFPLTKIGKVDYRALEQQAAETI